ncbi:MAG: hypothetical protein OWQ54_04835 [Sulfolobaceae archaeon]|nr:hypothetical protein [Sulfolobaceae archaeon]
MITKMIRSILTSRGFWVWGFTFSILWLLIGALMISQYIDRQYTYYYVGLVTSAIIVWVFSNLMSNLSGTIVMSSTSLYYAFKFTRLTPSRYLLDYLVSTVIGTTTLGALMLGISLGAFYVEYHVVFLPQYPLAFFGVIIISSAFVILFSIFISLIFPPKYYQFAQMLPQLLYVILVLGQMLVSYPYLIVVASPFNDMTLLLFQSFTGLEAPLDFLNPFQQFINWYYILASLIIWSLVLFSLDSYLLSRIKPVSLDILRQF